MQHFLTLATLHSLATTIVLMKIKAGELHIHSSRQYRDAIVQVIHSAFANAG